MEYLDFSSVITTIRNYISDAHSMNQIDMMYQLFVSFLSSDESLDFDFDNGLVCRWFNGQAKISPRITRYYMDNHNRNRLAADMHRNVLPLMYDSTMAVQEIYNILVQDTTISDKTKARLLENYPCETEMDEAVFLTYLQNREGGNSSLPPSRFNNISIHSKQFPLPHFGCYCKHQPMPSDHEPLMLRLCPAAPAFAGSTVPFFD